jgi:menaquinone-specific isochorismate synthase
MTIASSQPTDLRRAATALTRVSVPAPGLTPEAFLAASGTPRGFWSRDGRWSAWSGSVVRLQAGPGEEGGPLAAVRRRASKVVGRRTEDAFAPRFHGGISFHADHREIGAWRSFPAARFDLPRAQLTGTGRDEPELVITVRGSGPPARDRAARRAAGLLELAGRRADAAAPPPILRIMDVVTREAWTHCVEAALEAIAAGRFRKVVLARPVEVALGARPDAAGLLLRLRTREEGSFPFLFEPVRGTIFLGASPELVAVRSDGRFSAMAVAGTARRSGDREEDERLGRELLESAKDRTEHAIGVRDMRDAMAALGREPIVDERPHLLRLRGIQHLRTDLSVGAGPGRGVLDLLEAMHPTAAVSGYPRESAAAFLREQESFERGWYAGPVGWFDAAGDGAFAPALRCAVVRGDRARLFAGAGIVEGSDPGREWEETALKLGPALEILGGGREA